LPNQRIQRTAKNVTSFAIAKVPPFFAAADAGVEPVEKVPELTF
jgi:hypothetical protein